MHAASVPAAAQPSDVLFGSADDPRETVRRVWWLSERRLDLRGGLSLIGAQWRAMGHATYGFSTTDATGQLRATLRAGYFGDYRPDADEWYDALRVVQFIRLQPRSVPGFYARLGPLSRTRLGTGHLVDFLTTSAAWDERTVGVEVAQQGRLASLYAFSDNVLLDGVVGARLALQPLAFVDSPPLRGLTVGASLTTDLASHREGRRHLMAYNLDLQVEALRSGTFTMVPFFSYAWYERYGSGTFFGTEFASPNFVDLGRLSVRVGLSYSGLLFMPGYYGAFYSVHNPYRRILTADSFLADPETPDLEGLTLNRIQGGYAFLSEFRLVFFERFELWYAFRRHYGGQPLSEYHLRIFFRSPERLRFEVGLDRSGLTNFFSLFNDLGDQTLLVFDTEYQVFDRFWIHLSSLYTYERLEGNLPDGVQRFLVQRRFEPLAGVRFVF